MRLSLVLCIIVGATGTLICSAILEWAGFSSLGLNTLPAVAFGILTMLGAAAVFDIIQRRRVA